ncbi:MAG TPA: glutamine--fructose-6-phosphate aminotransferase, partial [Gemmatimonadales bacterium]|nr:glutamine--fructose-6-phosphate aminotransferase [Gemmatimonadales bacterium]
MCGIVGYVGPRQAAGLLLEGLRRLEYRGYDSSGIAVVNGAGLTVMKQAGKLSALEKQLEGSMPKGSLGIGHTRWATHGAPTTPNAHPHTDQTGRIALIHNGIIE